MFARLRRERPNVMILTATYPDISRFLDLRPRSRIRVERGMKLFNDACRAVAGRHHVVLLEGFDHPVTTERSSFAEDGFHHVDDWVPQRLVTATGPNPLPR